MRVPGNTSDHKRASVRYVLRAASVLLLMGLIGVAATLNDASASTPVTPPRGVSGDLWADVVVGQPDFFQAAPNQVVDNKLHLTFGGGVIVDSRSFTGHPDGVLYVWDGGNSRVLGVDLEDCYAATPCSGEIVIGQPSGTDKSACNGDSNFQSHPKIAPASATSLCGLPEEEISFSETITHANMAVDSSGDLFIPDEENHRVLRYDSPFENDTTADQVWGQDDFTENLCNAGDTPNPTASTICFEVSGRTDLNLGGGVTVDAAGNLWVADSGNARVLRFPLEMGTISDTADLVLGQAVFTTRGMGTGLNQMDYPLAVRFDGAGNLYVADSDGDGGGGGKRVLVFEPPFTNGMAAEGTFGSGMCPRGLELDDYSGSDPNRGGMWVQDVCNSRLILWDLDGTTPKKIIGKDEIDDLGVCNTPMCSNSGSIGIDQDGNVIVSNGRFNNDVLRFDDPLPNPGSGHSWLPDYRFFTGLPPQGYNEQGSKGLMGSVQGLEVTSGASPQMIVADAKRILFWDDPSTLVTHQAADGVIVPGESPANQDFTHNSPWVITQLKWDGERLWAVIDITTANMEIWIYDLPLTTGATPTQTITLPIPAINDEGTLSFQPADIELIIRPTEGGDFVWLSFPGSNRTVRVRNPLTDPEVDVVLGQLNLSGTDCNRGGPELANTLCRAGIVSIDNWGDLYVSDHWLENAGNRRLLVFNGGLFPPDNTSVIFAPSATKIFPDGTPQHATWTPAFDSCNRMVVGYNGFSPTRFVGVYEDPRGPSTTPDDFLNDFSSHAYTTVFDEDDNLYVADLNRSRVLIYEQPFDSCPDRVQNLTIDVTDGDNMTASWDAVPGATGYDFCVALSYNPGGSWLCNPETTLTKYNGAAPVAAGSKAILYYAVRALNGTEEGRFSNRAVVTVFNTAGLYNSYHTVYKDGTTGNKMVNGFNRHASATRWLAFSNQTPAEDIKDEVSGDTKWFSSATEWTADDWTTIFGPLIKSVEAFDEDLSPSASTFMSTLCMVIYIACE